MAASAPSMPPPPQAGGGPPLDSSGASPAPAQSSPQLDRATKIAVTVVQGLRQLAQDFPAVAPEVTQMNDLMRRILMKTQQGASVGESAAPPVNG